MSLKDKLILVLRDNKQKIEEEESRLLQENAFKQGREDINKCLADLFFAYLEKQSSSLLEIGIEFKKTQENRIVLTKDEVLIIISFSGSNKDEHKQGRAIYNGFVFSTEEAPNQVRNGNYLEAYHNVQMNLPDILNDKEYVLKRIKMYFTDRDFENWLLKALTNTKMI
ncbi:hypothetical protein P4H71_17570 [Paenibacillus kribbensis]|uniref:hypothetical protein n=1 Tax=Paenibacillus TaxID=44249 RepID=UPI0005C6B169|nr:MULTISPECIES: hypothetical protein [Paenibacillus]MEC0236135.1 hypothetical protein [Paenibacillus kribbensis]